MALNNLYLDGFRALKTWCEAGLLKDIDIVSAHPYRPRPDEPDMDRDIKRLTDYLETKNFGSSV